MCEAGVLVSSVCAAARSSIYVRTAVGGALVVDCRGSCRTTTVTVDKQACMVHLLLVPPGLTRLVAGRAHKHNLRLAADTRPGALLYLSRQPPQSGTHQGLKHCPWL